MRRPNSAGSAPSTSEIEPMKAGSRNWLKPETPSGSSTPLMRYWTLPCSLRTWKPPLPAVSCVTPGSCRTSWSKRWLSPCGRDSMPPRSRVVTVAPALVKMRSRDSLNRRSSTAAGLLASAVTGGAPAT